METQRVFVMIKPDHMYLSSRIFNLLDRSGLMIMRGTVNSVQKDVIREHYKNHEEKSFFGYMAESFVGGSVEIAGYERPDAIYVFRQLAGNTDPAKAKKGTIRAAFSDDSLDLAIQERRPVRNVIHVSDSAEEAEREINVWRRFMYNISRV